MLEKPIPMYVKYVASLGSNFCYIFENDEIDNNSMKAYLDELDSKIDNFETRHEFRRYKQFEEKDLEENYSTQQQKIISKMAEDTRKFLRSNKDIFILRADKGGKTVIMDKHTYYQKMDELVFTCLQDNIFFLVKKEFWELQSYIESKYEELRQLINPFFNKDRSNNISDVPFFLEFEPFIIARIYGCPKIHKDGVPMRPIIAAYDTIGKRLSNWILEKLKLIAAKYSKFNIKNSVDFFERLNRITLPDDVELATFDYDSMFTNIPFGKAKKIIELNYDIIENETSVPKDIFMKALSFFIEDNAYFSYKDCFYRQCKGLTMGNNLSQIIAEIYTNYALHQAVESSPNDKIVFIGKYVDDIFTCTKSDYINELESIISTFSGGIKLKHERENDDNEIVYLNTLIKRNVNCRNILTLRWYQKPTSSCTVLNYHSAHPYHIKENLINEFVRSALRITSNLHYDATISLIYKTLRNSDYPRKMIKGSITRVRSIEGSISITSEVGETDSNIMEEYSIRYPVTSKSKTIKSKENNLQKNYKFITIPNFKPFKKHLNKILKKSKVKNVKLITKISKTNKCRIFTNLKDKKLLSCRKDASFTVECMNCEFTYCAKTYYLDIERTVKHLICNLNSPVHKHIVEFKHMINPVPINIINSH